MNFKEDCIKAFDDFYEQNRPQVQKAGIGLATGMFLGAPFGPVGMAASGVGLATFGIISGSVEKSKEQKGIETTKHNKLI